MKYEAHITIEPVFDERLAEFTNLCKLYGFRAAKLLMQKTRADTATRSSRDSFCTGHGNDYDEILLRGRKLVNALRQIGMIVWRFKIEEILLDERY